MTTFKQALGEIIEKQREHKGITREEYSEIIGTDLNTLKNWETGLTMPATRYLEQIAVLNGISVDVLMDIAKEHTTVNRENVIVETMAKNDDGTEAPGEADDMPSAGETSEHGHADESDEDNHLIAPDDDYFTYEKTADVVKVGEQEAQEVYDPQLDESITEDDDDESEAEDSTEKPIVRKSTVTIYNQHGRLMMKLGVSDITYEDGQFVIKGPLRDFKPDAAPGLVIQRENALDELIGEMERVLQQTRELKTKRP